MVDQLLEETCTHTITPIPGEQIIEPSPAMRYMYGIRSFGIIDSALSDNDHGTIEPSHIEASKALLMQASTDRLVQQCRDNIQSFVNILHAKLTKTYIKQFETMQQSERQTHPPDVHSAANTRLHDDYGIDIVADAMIGGQSQAQEYLHGVLEEHPDIRMLTTYIISDQTRVMMNFFYSGGETARQTIMKRTWDTYERLIQGMNDATEIVGELPPVINVFIAPEVEEVRNPDESISYHDLFTGAESLFGCLGTSSAADDSKRRPGTIVIIPKRRDMERFALLTRTERSRWNIQTPTEYMTHVVSRHEGGHLVYGMQGQASQYIEEGFARFMEMPDADASSVHEKIHPSSLDVGRVLDLIDQPDQDSQESFTVSYDVYSVPHSLIQFLFDYSGKDISMLGEFLTALSGDERIPIREALDMIYDLDENSLRTHWLEAIKEAQKH